MDSEFDKICSSLQSVGIYVTQPHAAVIHVLLISSDGLNRFTPDWIDRLKRLLDWCSRSKRVRVFLIGCRGRYFSAGADLKGILDAPDPRVAEKIGADIKSVLDHIQSATFATICSVSSPALGIGVGLVAASDFSIATRDTYFSMPELRHGMSPTVVAPILAGRFGVYKLREWVISAKRIPAIEAAQCGLLTKVVESQTDLEEVQKELINALLLTSPEAIADFKAAWPIQSPMSTSEYGRLFAEAISKQYAKEGISAFLSKSRPSWAESFE